MNFLKNDYGDLKFIIRSSGLETNFRKLKYTVGFVDRIKKREILMEVARHKLEELNRYLAKIKK